MFQAAVSQTFVGEVTGGFRIDLHFEDGSPDVAASPLWADSARLLSGNDWVAVTTEGVMDFDSRFTVEFSKELDGEAKRIVRVPVGARLRGRASVRDTKRADHTARFADDENINSVMNTWQRGLEDAYLPLRLTVTFDIPREGFTKEETDLYGKLQVLGRGLFIGCGQAYFDGNPYGSVDRIELGVYRMVGDPGAGP